MTNQSKLKKELVQALRDMIEQQKQTVTLLEGLAGIDLVDERTNIELLEKNLKTLEDKLSTLEKR